jgi:hypothetical protein
MPFTRTVSVLSVPSGVGAETWVTGSRARAKVCSRAALLPLPSVSRTVSPWVARTTFAFTRTVSRL